MIYTIMLVLQVILAMYESYSHRWWHSLYWISAVGITVSVMKMK